MSGAPKVRPARSADIARLAEVHVRSWQATYPSLLEGPFDDAPTREERVAQWLEWLGPTADPTRTILVAEREGRVLGFVVTGPSRDEDRGLRTGEIGALYVDPDAQGTGVGLALVQAARAALVDAHHSTATLWVLAGNDRARRFYAASGWEPDGGAAHVPARKAQRSGDPLPRGARLSSRSQSGNRSNDHGRPP